MCKQINHHPSPSVIIQFHKRHHFLKENYDICTGPQIRSDYRYEGRYSVVWRPLPFSVLNTLRSGFVLHRKGSCQSCHHVAPPTLRAAASSGVSQSLPFLPLTHDTTGPSLKQHLHLLPGSTLRAILYLLGWILPSHLGVPQSSALSYLLSLPSLPYKSPPGTTDPI